MSEGDIFDQPSRSTLKEPIPLPPGYMMYPSCGCETLSVLPTKTSIDLLAMNPNIRADFGNPDMRHYWDALLRIHGWDKMDALLRGLPFNSTIDDVRKKLCGESLTLEDRTMKALKRRGAAGGLKQAQELIELVKCQGACHSHESVCDCLYWIFSWHVKRSLTIKWPSDFLPLIHEWKDTGRPKQPKADNA